MGRREALSSNQQQKKKLKFSILFDKFAKE
jgi:hypothetical protein